MYHKIVVVGNLGRDPELRYTPSGSPVTNLSLATNRKFTTSDGEQKEETVWFRVTVWGKQAETVSQYLRKGRQVLVEGRLNPDENGNPRIWQRQDGTPAANFEMTAQTVRFLGSRPQDVAEQDIAGDSPDEEIPF